MPSVLNKRTDIIPVGAVYIGKPSKWGNPYKMNRNFNREKVIVLYREWIIKQIESGKLDIEELRGKDLVCWCSPEPCHGDVLLELANK